MMRPPSIPGAVLLSLALSCAVCAQAPKAKKTPVVSPTVNTSGILRSISDTEADLDGIDADGHARTFVFILTKLTTRQPCKKGDAVIIEFESHGAKLIATSIQLAGIDGKHSKVDPGGVGGVSKAIPPMAMPAPTRQLANTQQTATSVTPSSPESTQSEKQSASANSEIAPPEPPQVPSQYATTYAGDVAPASTVASANPSANPALTEELLTQLYPLTRTTADQSDIITAGAVVTLNRDGLLMSSIDKPYTPANTYRDGAIETNSRRSNGLKAWAKLPSADSANDVVTRKFIRGEKFWVTGVEVRKDSVVMKVYSDEYNGVRYHGQLTFPIDRNSNRSTQALLNTIQEVVSTDPDDRRQIMAMAAPMAAIAPPPPPSNAPPQTLEVGQTREQVIAALGQPSRTAKLGTKEIFFYPDMKIIFKNGKVTDIE